MTTIAYSDRTQSMAADTQIHDGAGLLHYGSKILTSTWHTPGGYCYHAKLCVAASGRRDDGIRLYRKLLDSTYGEGLDFDRCSKYLERLDFNESFDIDPKDEHSSFIVSLAGIPQTATHATQRLYVYARSGRVLEPIGSRGYYAIGSGRDFALMAMRLKKTPTQAVKLAHEFDVNTGPDVLEVSLWPR